LFISTEKEKMFHIKNKKIHITKNLGFLEKFYSLRIIQIVHRMDKIVTIQMPKK